jgi:hypothetical protein
MLSPATLPICAGTGSRQKSPRTTASLSPRSAALSRQLPRCWCVVRASPLRADRFSAIFTVTWAFRQAVLRVVAAYLATGDAAW